ncbi:hypothetical protein [Arcobacter sp. CECT 8985]|nr:hypothetical protein [Arcobacter sp. CECT 8985]
MNIQEKIVEDHKETVEKARINKTYVFPAAYIKFNSNNKTNKREKQT